MIKPNTKKSTNNYKYLTSVYRTKMKTLYLIISIKFTVIILAIGAYFLGDYLNLHVPLEISWIKLLYGVWFLVTVVIYYQLIKLLTIKQRQNNKDKIDSMKEQKKTI